MDEYRAYSRSGKPFAIEMDFTTAAVTTTLVTARSASHYVYVQKIVCTIKTDAAQALTFQDSAATPEYLFKVTTSPGADTTWSVDFGPRGRRCTLGKNLTATFSAAGLAGHLEVVGYQSKRAGTNVTPA